MRRKILVLIVMLALVATKEIWAEEEIVELETIVVTPSRAEEPYSEVSRSMNIVTESKIVEKSARSVDEVLESLPSVHIVDYGPMGAGKYAEIRGSTDKQVLVMVDGRVITDPAGGDKANLSNVPTENIERIEVIRGPASNLYGSSAMGGVVNIITKSAKERPETTFTSKFGTFRTYSEELTHGARVNKFDYFLTTSFDKQAGYRDNSEYEAYSLNSKIGYQINNQNRLTLSSGYYEDEFGSPGSVSSPTLDTKQEDFKNFVDLTWEMAASDTTKIKLKAYQNCDRLEYINSPAPLDKDTHQTKKRNVDLQMSLLLPWISETVFGMNTQENLVNSSKFSKHKYDIKSGYLQNEIYISEPFKLILGGRIDDYSNFGTEFSPSGSFLYKLDGKTKFHGLVARSFRAPSFSELYWPATSMATGNPNLRPEKGISGDVGMERLFAKSSSMGITYFRNDIDDLVSWVGSGYQATNINSATIEGVELEIKNRIIKKISSEFNYTYLRAKDDKRDKYLTYKPKHTFNYSLKYGQVQGLMIGLDMRYVTKRFTNSQNTITLDNYFTLDLNLTKRIGENFTYLLSINNLLDRQYQTRLGYPMPGFSITSGLRLEF